MQLIQKKNFLFNSVDKWLLCQNKAKSPQYANGFWLSDNIKLIALSL